MQRSQTSSGRSSGDGRTTGKKISWKYTVRAVYSVYLRSNHLANLANPITKTNIFWCSQWLRAQLNVNAEGCVNACTRTPNCHTIIHTWYLDEHLDSMRTHARTLPIISGRTGNSRKLVAIYANAVQKNNDLLATDNESTAHISLHWAIYWVAFALCTARSCVC